MDQDNSSSVRVLGRWRLAAVALLALVGANSLLFGASPLRARPVSAAFSGASGKIAFQSNRDGNGEIYVMNADGSGQTNLTNNAADDLAPAWSPDGSKIAFVSTRDNPNPSSCFPCNFEIYVMSADGSAQTRLTNDPGIDADPAWSPDGSQIAFASGFAAIYVMNADGSGREQLTSGAIDIEPAWSPDGTKIAFSRDFDDIFVMNDDGTGQVRLTNSPATDWEPGWSPDGMRITFTSDRDGNEEVYVMNADGSAETNVTKSTAGDFTPAWSPDGSQIVFASDRADDPEVFVMNADGTGQTRLTTNPADDFDPDWQPVGGPLELLGDVNCDQAVSSIDVALVLQLDAQLLTSLPCQQNADVNRRDGVSAVDATLILQFNAGLIWDFTGSAVSDPTSVGGKTAAGFRGP